MNRREKGCEGFSRWRDLKMLSCRFRRWRKRLRNIVLEVGKVRKRVFF